MPYLLRSLITVHALIICFGQALIGFFLIIKYYSKIQALYRDCEIVCKNTLIKWRRAHIISMPTKVESKQRHNENQKR